MKNKVVCWLMVTTILAGLFFLSVPVSAAAPAVKIKNLGRVLEARDNQLMGFGLVVGLKNTGDSTQTGFTRQALTNLLSRMGIVPQTVDFKSRNVAAVMVTCNLPAFSRSGQKLDVQVSAMGDASSLQGGTLLITPLQGADEQVYAVAQGNVLVGENIIEPTLSPLRSKITTAGRIPGGALVEQEVPVSMADQGKLSIVLDRPDFTTAKHLADAIRNKGYEARAADAGLVIVTLNESENLVDTIAKIENIPVVPGSIAKIVVNEKNGTIVIGEDVRIAPVAVAYGEYRVVIGNLDVYTQVVNQQGGNQYQTTAGRANVVRPPKKMISLGQAAQLSDLVTALNRLGATPRDLINILQAIKAAGAMSAEIEVI